MAPLTRRLNASAGTHVGNVRERNEDACGFYEAAGVAFVADGMGGHPAGDVASRLVAECVGDIAREIAAGTRSEFPADFVVRAQSKLRAHVDADPRHAGLGTTLDAICLLSNDILQIVHIGDSRAYRIAAGKLTPLTLDHSYVGELVRAGQLTRELARVHPMSNLITRYIGDDTSFAADFLTVPVVPGTRILLATDGLTDMLPEAEIESLCASTPDRERLVDTLLEAALRRGGLDNISAVVADLA